MTTTDDRFTRQAELVPHKKLKLITATVIGIGAVGRHVALQLAAMGAGSIRLIDFDRVELTNITTQGYASADAGRLKVECTRDAIRRIDPSIDVETIADRYRPTHSVGTAQPIFSYLSAFTHSRPKGSLTTAAGISGRERRDFAKVTRRPSAQVPHAKVVTPSLREDCIRIGCIHD